MDCPVLKGTEFEKIAWERGIELAQSPTADRLLAK